MTVYLAPSIWRSMDVRTATAVMSSIVSNPTDEHIVWEPLWNDAAIARSRSLLATKMLTEPHLADCDVMVIVDDDVVWEPADFWKIVEGCRETRSIYGGVYVTRSTTPHLSSRLFPDTKLDIRQTPNRRPLELEYLATGFWAVHRDVLEAMVKGEFRDADGTHRIHSCSKGAERPFWPFFAMFTIEDAPGSFHFLSEDWAFCERARQLRFKVWMDQSIILQHMGWYPFTVADINRPGDPGLPSTGTDLLEVRGPDRNTGEPLIDTLIADIAEFSEESEGDIRRMLPTGTAKVAELWATKPAGEPEFDFYRREDVGLAYILDLAYWHLNGGCPADLALGHAGKTLVDFGAGIGTFALIAAREGASVSIIEPNAVLNEFALWRAKKHGIALSSANGLGSPDVVVAWHVFEHLAYAEDTLRSIAQQLPMGASLISDSDFCAAHGHPMHHVRDDWDQVLARYGFELESPNVYRLGGVAAAYPEFEAVLA